MRYISIYLLVVCVLISAHHSAAEQPLISPSADTEQPSMVPENRQSLIPSPLLDEAYNRPFVSISALGYVPSQHLYPVRVMTINKYQIKPLLHGYEYRLAGGSYEIEVSPDFSLLTNVQRFMNNSFETKRIKVSLTNRSSYILGARINPQDPSDWTVELLELGEAVTQ